MENQMDTSENTLIRSTPCEICGARMLWTQGAWTSPSQSAACYRCDHGHITDPADTPQCPRCGVHDTERRGEAEFSCARCQFKFPRPVPAGRDS
jgi:hypothetical protein